MSLIKFFKLLAYSGLYFAFVILFSIAYIVTSTYPGQLTNSFAPTQATLLQVIGIFAGCFLLAATFRIWRRSWAACILLAIFQGSAWRLVHGYLGNSDLALLSPTIPLFFDSALWRYLTCFASCCVLGMIFQDLRFQTRET